MIDVFKFIIFIVGMVAIIIAGLRLVRAKDEFELACLRSISMSFYIVRFEPKIQDRQNPPRFLEAAEVTHIWKKICAALYECGDNIIAIKPAVYTLMTSYASINCFSFEVSFERLEDARKFTTYLAVITQNISISYSESIEQLEA